MRLLSKITAISAAGMLAMGTGLPAEVVIRVGTDARAGEAVPISVRFRGSGDFDLGGAKPRAWLIADASGACAIPAVGSGAREIDGSLLVLLNTDRTISAVDPAYSLASSNIAWIARLPEQPSTWLLDRDRGEAVVALPTGGEIRRIDLADGMVRQAIAGVGRVATLVAAPEIDVIWASDGKGITRFASDNTTRRFDLRTDGALLWAGHRRVLAVADGKRIRLIGSDGTIRADVTVTEPVAALALSPLADRLYALARGGRSVTPVALENGTADPAIPVPGKADRLLSSPDGRWLFAIDRAQGLLSIIDVAQARISRILQITAGIESAGFSDNYLYLRERDRAFVSLVLLSSLADRKEHVVAVPVGITASNAGALAPLNRDGMAMLNAAERTVYLYMESGMADGHGTMRTPTEMLAPYAAVKLRGGLPADLAVHDRGLREDRPGHFTTTVRPPHGGQWRLVVRDSTTQETGCVDFTVSGAVATPARLAGTRLVVADAKPTNGAPLQLLAVRAVAAPLHELPPSIAFRAFVPGDNWQAEFVATRQGGDRYTLDAKLPAGRRIALIPLDGGFDGAAPLMIETAP